MKLHIVVIVIVLLAGSMSLVAWNDNFDSYESTVALRKAWHYGKNSPNLAKHKGINGSKAAQLVYNGQKGLKNIDLACEPGRSIKIELSIKAARKDGSCRFFLGTDDLTWKKFQLALIFQPGQKILYADGKGRLKTANKFPDFFVNKWYRLKIIIYPAFKSGGTYDVFINGKQLCDRARFRDESRRISSRIIVGSYASRSEKPEFLFDDVSVDYGKLYPVTLKEKIIVSLPPKKIGGRRFYEGRVDTELKFAGQFSALKAFNVKLFPNHFNHADEAEKQAVAEKSFRRTPEAVEKISFSKLPYGMYTMRVYGTDFNKKENLLLEELISVIHNPPKQGRVWPPVWGICSHADRFDRKVDLEMKNLREVGANWARMEFILWDIYKAGEYRLAHHDRMYRLGKDKGIKFFGLLNTTPKGCGAGPNSKGGCSPPDLKKWEELCRTIMTHFKDKINYWEIWNEPNGYAFWEFLPGVERATHHARMMQIASKVAQSISPDIKVMGPCATPSGVAYFRNVVKAGGFDNTNYVSFHCGPGRHPKNAMNLEMLKILRKKYPKRKFEFWVSEGANSFPFLIAGFADKKPLPRFAYVIRDKGTRRNYFEHENGMSKYDGLPKDYFIKYQFTVKSFANSKYIGRIFAAEGLEGYLFERNGVYTAGVWTEGDVMVPLPDWISTPDIKRYDLLGNPLLKKSGKWLVGNEPIIVTGFKPDGKVVVDASINCEEDYAEVYAGRDNKLIFSFSNHTKEVKKYSLVMNTPENCRLSKRSLQVTVAPGKTMLVEAMLKINDDAPIKDIYVNAVLKLGNMLVKKKFGPFVIQNYRRIKTVKIDDFQSGLKWELPHIKQDIHSQTCHKRVAKDQQRLSKGSKVLLCSDPENVSNHVLSMYYFWQRPGVRWDWVARSYTLKKPILLPGMPLELKMRVYQDDNPNKYPLTLLLIFKDATGKIVRIEGGGEMYWFGGWRDISITLPSLLSRGYIHSVSGGDKRRRITRYPLTFIGLIVNLVPARAVTHFPESQKSVKGQLLLDDIRVKCYK